jgi:hypothetical protein
MPAPCGVPLSVSYSACAQRWFADAVNVRVEPFLWRFIFPPIKTAHRH